MILVISYVIVAYFKFRDASTESSLPCSLYLDERMWKEKKKKHEDVMGMRNSTAVTGR